MSNQLHINSTLILEDSEMEDVDETSEVMQIENENFFNLSSKKHTSEDINKISNKKKQVKKMTRRKIRIW
jgi:hypothetical protein